MSVTRRGRVPLVAGTVAGLAAWLVGYLCTYLVVAPDVRESGLNRIVEAFGGDPATAKLVGWVFFNAHFVETVVRGVPFLGGGSASFVGGDGFTPLLYVVPAGLLAAAGVALARRYGTGATGATADGNARDGDASADGKANADATADVGSGLLAGLSTLPGYLLATVVGVFLFEVTVGGVSGQPDLLPAVFLAGIVYPLVFAGGGGAVAALTAD